VAKKPQIAKNKTILVTIDPDPFTKTFVKVKVTLASDEKLIFNNVVYLEREDSSVPGKFDLHDTLTTFTSIAAKEFEFQKNYNPMAPLPPGNYRVRVEVVREGKATKTIS
jgi:hypothetical protein